METNLVPGKLLLHKNGWFTTQLDPLELSRNPKSRRVIATKYVMIDPPCYIPGP